MSKSKEKLDIFLEGIENDDIQENKGFLSTARRSLNKTAEFLLLKSIGVFMSSIGSKSKFENMVSKVENVLNQLDYDMFKAATSDPYKVGELVEMIENQVKVDGHFSYIAREIIILAKLAERADELDLTEHFSKDVRPWLDINDDRDL
jgi:hypothetical protein